MSTRLYPLYQRGNPQRRVFLPNFFMKLIRPSEPRPSNVVTFSCSMQMTEHDAKQYLEKIYNVPVKHIKMEIQMGEFNRANPGGYVIKDDDEKMAYVTLGDNQVFKFPNLFPEEKFNEEEKELKDFKMLKTEFKSTTTKETNRKGLPSWFKV